MAAGSPYNGEENPHRTRIKTREETRELDRRRRELAAKQDALAEIEQTAMELDQKLIDLKGGVSKMRVHSLGVDRFHRKYWFFHHSSPNKGVFVEDNGYGQSVETMEATRQGMGFVERLQFDLDGWPLIEVCAVNSAIISYSNYKFNNFSHPTLRSLIAGT